VYIPDREKGKRTKTPELIFGIAGGEGEKGWKKYKMCETKKEKKKRQRVLT